MTKNKYVLWSDIDLDFDDWKDEISKIYGIDLPFTREKPPRTPER